MRRAAQLGRVLRACVAEHDWSQPPRELASGVAGLDLTGLAATAEHHGVSGCVMRSMRLVRGVSATTLAELEESYHLALASHLRTIADVQLLADLFEGLRIPWIVLKGPVLADVVYRDAGLRSYLDLDVLVQPAALGRALSGLEKVGCRVVEQNWTMVRRQMVGEIHLVAKNGSMLDLHWHLFNDARLRASFDVRTEALFESSRVVPLGGRSVCTLQPVETLVHLALHAAMAGGNRLVWLKDLEQSVLNEAPDWNAVIEKATAWQARFAVGAMLARAERALGVPVPHGVLRELVPAKSWRCLLQAVDRLPPTERSTGRSSPARIVARSARADARSSGRELRQHLASRWQQKRFALFPPAQDWDDASAGSILHPAGGESDRMAFLDEVAREL
jgi:hypothetical protein